MQYLYHMADLRILCQIPFPVRVQKECENFVSDMTNQNIVDQDLTFRFCPVQTLGPIPPVGHWDTARFYSRSATYFYTSKQGSAYALVQKDSDGNGTVKYLAGHEDYLNYSTNICDLLGLESILLQHQALLLHASFVRAWGQGVLFSAPSGTGKSTQAELWKQYFGADIINGDRAILRLEEGKWQAFGSPYAGSSRIYRNEKAPVCAIIVLRQARKNHIRLLPTTQSVFALFPEITIHRWDETFTVQALQLLTALLSRVPVYLLECRPDREAVETASRVIFPERSL